MNVISQQVSDSELLQQYVDGSNQAMEQLLRRHKDKIYSSIYLLVKDSYLAEDLFQETFLKIIRCVRNGKYAEQGKFLPWALCMAHNLCMDHFRKMKTRAKITLMDGSDATDWLADKSPNPIDIIEKGQTCHQVRELVALLPDAQREVLVLRMYAERSFKEIAELTGVSINTALGRMRYGLMNLKKMVEEKRVAVR